MTIRVHSDGQCLFITSKYPKNYMQSLSPIHTWINIPPCRILLLTTASVWCDSFELPAARKKNASQTDQTPPESALNNHSRPKKCNLILFFCWCRSECLAYLKRCSKLIGTRSKTNRFMNATHWWGASETSHPPILPASKTVLSSIRTWEKSRAKLY